MEGRIAVSHDRAHRGVALLALVFIGVVTASWWALALYPAGATAPEWLVRTRLACFGAMPGGLPNAGGWILLIATPLSLMAVLVAVWGDALARDWRAAMQSPWGRAAAVAAFLAAAWGARWTVRVLTAYSAPAAEVADDAPVRVEPAPSLLLTDQHGSAFDLHAERGPVLLTFAYAHCETVCPVTVQQLRAVRDTVAPRVPIVVVTLDPWRDTPSRLPTIATQWSLAPGDRVLSGSVAEVAATLAAWGVPYTRDTTTGVIDHVAPVMLVEARGASLSRFVGVTPALRGALSTRPR